MPSSPTKVTPPYKYACEDKSWLTGLLARTVVRQIEKRLPFGMPANHITLLSSACLVVMTLLLWLAPEWRLVALIVGVGLLVAYTLLDMVDGQRARRLGTSSPLGEYLDHSLDILNAAIIAVAVFLVRPEWSPESLLWLLAVVSLSFGAALTEQCVDGVLRLGAIGPVEALLLVSCYLLSWLIPGAEAWWEQAALGGWSRFAVCAAVASVGFCAAAASSVWRMRRLPQPLALFAVGLLVFPCLLHFGVSPWAAILALVLWTTDFGVRIIQRHLQYRELPWPDLAGLGIAGLLLLMIAVSVMPREWLEFLPAAWLGGRLAWNVAGTLKAYRQYWAWWHRPSPSLPAATDETAVETIAR